RVSQLLISYALFVFFFQAEDGIRDWSVTGVQTCALPIYDLCQPSGKRCGQERRSFSCVTDHRFLQLFRFPRNAQQSGTSAACCSLACQTGAACWRAAATPAVVDSPGPNSRPAVVIGGHCRWCWRFAMSATATMPRALIVEDEIVIAMDIEAQMKKLGFDVCGLTSNAREALSLAMEEPPDVAIMDVYLQGARDGIEVARQIRDL